MNELPDLKHVTISLAPVIPLAGYNEIDMPQTNMLKKINSKIKSFRVLQKSHRKPHSLSQDMAQVCTGNSQIQDLLTPIKKSDDTSTPSNRTLYPQIDLELPVFTLTLCTRHCKPPPRESMEHGWGFERLLTLCLTQGGGRLIRFFALPSQRGGGFVHFGVCFALRALRMISSNDLPDEHYA